MSAPVPYTGRDSADARDVAAEVGDVLAARYATPPAKPRIRWGRIAALHLGAGLVAGFVVPLVMLGTADSSWAQWIAVAFISAVVVCLVGGGLPLLLAWVAWALVSRNRRGPWREVGAVVAGALLGSLLVSVALTALVGLTALTAVLLIGLPSAIGFMIWVLVAWGPHLQGLPVR